MDREVTTRYDQAEAEAEASTQLLGTVVHDVANGSTSDEVNSKSYMRTHPRRLYPSRFAWILAVAASTAVIFWMIQRLMVLEKSSVERCANGLPLTVRREWRSLLITERKDYLSALQCLRTSSPSQIYPAQTQITRWYDFAWTHYHVGYIAHDAACFLPWHRWFLALFEASLRKDCGYSGPIPYWDWTRDWQNPERSPIFDPETGFGGNGDPSRPSSANGAWCVTEGPFGGARIPFDFDAVANQSKTLDAQHIPDSKMSFCLSRQFSLGTTFNASHLSPEYISQVLMHQEYVSLISDLEFGPHNDIPFGINGTFSSLYAPADPIFWLHHCQLDRLWWIWQNMEPKHARAYGGPSTSKSQRPASLGDRLPFGELSDDVDVREVIESERGKLCYQYEQ